MPKRNRQRKSQLIEELSAQDQLITDLRQEMEEVKRQAEEKINQLENDLDAILTDKEAAAEENNKSEKQEAPSRLWPRLLAAGALLIFWIICLAFFVKTSFPYSVPDDVKDNRRGLVNLPEANYRIGPIDAHRIVIFYADPSVKRTKMIYRDYLLRLFRQRKANLLVYRPLNIDNDQQADSYLRYAAQRNILWKTLHKYWLNGETEQIAKSKTPDEYFNLQAHRLGLEKGGMVIKYQQKNKKLSLYTDKTKIAQTLGL